MRKLSLFAKAEEGLHIAQRFMRSSRIPKMSKFLGNSMQSLDFLGCNENVSTIKWLSAEKHNLNNSPFRIADAFSPQSIKFMEFRNQILPDSNAQILLFA